MLYNLFPNLRNLLPPGRGTWIDFFATSRKYCIHITAELGLRLARYVGAVFVAKHPTVTGYGSIYLSALKLLLSLMRFPLKLFDLLYHQYIIYIRGIFRIFVVGGARGSPIVGNFLVQWCSQYGSGNNLVFKICVAVLRFLGYFVTKSVKALMGLCQNCYTTFRLCSSLTIWCSKLKWDGG